MRSELSMGWVDPWVGLGDRVTQNGPMDNFECAAYISTGPRSLSTELLNDF